MIGDRIGDTFLTEITERHKILHPLGAARHVDVGLILRSVSVELFLIQVVRTIIDGWRSVECCLLLGGKVSHSLYFLRREVAIVLKLPQIVVIVDIGRESLLAWESILFIADSLVAEKCIFVGGHTLLKCGSRGNAIVGREADHWLAFRTALCSDDDYTVGTTHTIHCR